MVEADAAGSVASTVEMEVDDPALTTELIEAGGQAPPELNQDPPEYDDARRKAEILPPPEEWPETIRPPIRGKIKILEDGILRGTKVKLVKDDRRPPVSVAAPKSDGGPKKNVDAQSIMDSLAPMMLEWLKTNLTALGLNGTTGESSRKMPHLTKTKRKPQKGGRRLPKPKATRLRNRVLKKVDYTPPRSQTGNCGARWQVESGKGTPSPNRSRESPPRA